MESKFGLIRNGRWLNVEEERQSGITEIWIDGDLRATPYSKSLAFHLSVENVMKRVTTKENVLTGRSRKKMMQAQVSILPNSHQVVLANSLQGLLAIRIQGLLANNHQGLLAIPIQGLLANSHQGLQINKLLGLQDITIKLLINRGEAH